MRLLVNSFRIFLLYLLIMIRLLKDTALKSLSTCDRRMDGRKEMRTQSRGQREGTIKKKKGRKYGKYEGSQEDQ